MADLRSSDIAKRKAAEEAVRVLGAEAVPYLTNALVESRLDKLAEVARAKTPEMLRRPLGRLAGGSGSRIARANAVEALKHIGPPAEDSLPHLVGSLELSGLDGMAAIVKIGPAAVPELRTALRNGTFAQRVYAIRALAEFGNAATSAIPELLLSLQSSASEEAGFAASALAKMGEAAVVPLASTLSTATNAETRWLAAAALQMARPAVGSAVTNALAVALNDPHARVRREALAALSVVPAPESFTQPLYVRRLRDADAEVQALAAQLLSRSPSAVRAYRHELTAFTNHPDERVRAAVTEALARFPPRE